MHIEMFGAKAFITFNRLYALFKSGRLRADVKSWEILEQLSDWWLLKNV
jgi:hypothetical protein